MQRISDEQRERRNKIIISVIVAAVMVFSTFGIVMDYAGGGSQSERVKSDLGTLTFKVSGTTVIAQIKGQTIQFGYFPSHLSGINVSAGVKEALHQPAFYMTSDPQDPYNQSIDEMVFRYSEIMPVLTDSYPIAAFTSAAGFNRPVVDCLNATASMPVLYLKYGNDTGVTMQDNCIIAEARTPQEVLAVADKMLFVAMGVQNGN
jgi:hypothetical protein